MEKTAILELQNIRKVFDKNVALDSVSFSLYPGEIHGLLGGNGAGKTTLMNVLYGLYRKDDGEIIYHGKPLTVNGPRDAITHGIGMVHQHFLQIGNYTVLENIVLGTDVSHPGTMNLAAEAKKIEELGNRFSLPVNPHAVIDTLPVGTRQKVEILKALYRGVQVLILDEPTTNLTPQEVDDLFDSLRVIVNEGMSIVFITHKLREVLRVCDRITVLREGRNITSLTREEASEEIFVRAMVGEQMDIKDSVFFSQSGKQGKAVDMTGTPALELQKVCIKTKEGISRLTDVDFDIYCGEIFGVAGVAGNGQRELAESVTGVVIPSEGTVKVHGKDVTQMTNAELLKDEISYIPEDRLHDGFLPKANVAQNLILGHHKQQPYSNGTFINWNVVFDKVREQITAYHIKTNGPDDPGGNLSGGNIQRVMIARAFSMPSKVMVMHNPTRGLDIPSMDFVYTKVLERKEDGEATLLISEDLEELMKLCDRIAVIYRGQILGILNRKDFDKYAIGRLMSGIKAEETVDTRAAS